MTSIGLETTRRLVLIDSHGWKFNNRLSCIIICEAASIIFYNAINAVLELAEAGGYSSILGKS
jgi:hypothetical protein